jgi:hypothetical protein
VCISTTLTLIRRLISSSMSELPIGALVRVRSFDRSISQATFVALD